MPARVLRATISAMLEHVVVAGGGVGALEGVLALQSLAPRPLSISVLTAQRTLTYRPLAVAEPFGGAPAPRCEWSAIARDRGVRWIPDVVVGVRAEAREIETRDGPPVRYDALLLALGAISEPALPGALTFAGPRDVLAMLEAVERLEPGRVHRLAFVAVSDTAWTLPLYELALLTAARGRQNGLDLEIEVVTSESAPLGVFGAEASAAVGERLAAAGIHLRTGTVATEVADGRLWLELEGPLDVDLVVALPRLRGPAVPGLPVDASGFVPVDRFGRVRGLDAVWAVGDMTTRPLKQGGLATQQADVAAADIAVLAGAQIDVKPYLPVLRGLLLTGEEPAYLQRRLRAPLSSEVSSDFLWWPAHKVAGRHLGPYLASLVDS
jgi:sulfide:quinone oxidoreductase